MIGNDQMLKYRASRQLSRYESCSKVRNMHNNKDTHSMKGMREKKSAKVDANHKAILIIIKKKNRDGFKSTRSSIGLYKDKRDSKKRDQEQQSNTKNNNLKKKLKKVTKIYKIKKKLKRILKGTQKAARKQEYLDKGWIQFQKMSSLSLINKSKKSDYEYFQTDKRESCEIIAQESEYTEHIDINKRKLRDCCLLDISLDSDQSYSNLNMSSSKEESSNLQKSNDYLCKESIIPNRYDQNNESRKSELLSLRELFDQTEALKEKCKLIQLQKNEEIISNIDEMLKIWKSKMCNEVIQSADTNRSGISECYNTDVESGKKSKRDKPATTKKKRINI